MRVTPVLVRVDRRDQEVRTPGEILPGVGRIAVVRNDRLGDLILTLPAIDALRRTYPAAEIGVFVAPWVAPLARCVQGVDRVIDAPPDVGSVSEALRRFRPDLAISISRGAVPALAAVRAGVSRRIGTGYRFFSPLFTRRVSERRRAAERHEVEYALSFAHRAGAAPAIARFPLSTGEQAAAEADAWLASREIGPDFVLIHPGSGGSCPKWPLDHYLALADRLVSDGRTVLFTVGPSDPEVLAAVQGDLEAIGSVPVFRGSLPVVSEITRRASLVVSNSTALVHLAAAHATAALAIHAPWRSCGVERWGPYLDRGWGLVAEAPGAGDWPREERRKRATELMAGIPVDVVHRCVTAVLAGGLPEL